tara:strand:+ start:4186 stop:6180 length:1995 start_codon:yes stop_codon:yes gene_type:complete
MIEPCTPLSLLQVMTYSGPLKIKSLEPEDPLIEFNQGGELKSSRFGDVYASSLDPVGESEHVFIEGNQLQQRWREPPKESSSFHVGELGFGTGLNFLLTWKHWFEAEDKDPGWQHLYYSGFEAFPLSAVLMETVHQNWFKDPGSPYQTLYPYSKQLLDQWQDMMIGVHRIALDSSITLDLHINDAFSAMAQRPKRSRPMDAWFLDGFSPDRNPQLWKPQLFALLAEHSTPESTVATYTSAGHVRRNLGNAGLPVKRAKGWAKKRHMLSSPRETSKPDRFRSSAKTLGEIQKAVVLGSGLAGSTVAHALAGRGWQVKIMDPASGFGAGASGIPQLALRLRLFNEANAAAQIYLQAYLFTYRWLVRLASEGKFFWHRKQIRQSATAMNKRKPLSPEKLARIYGNKLFQTERNGSLCFPFGGWIDPIELCRALCSSPKITHMFNTPNPSFEAQEHGWRVQSSQGNQTEWADALIIASPQALERLPILNEAKLEFTTGISTAVRTCDELKKKDHIFTGLRTLFPARGNSHLVSATYQRVRAGESDAKAANQENIIALRQMLQSDLKAPLDVLTHYERERANTYDRLPLIGQFQKSSVSYNATNPIYISSAHGSTGLATCPFAAEIIAAEICGDPLPVTEEQRLLLDPSRYYQRAQKKNRQTSSESKKT